MKLLMAVVVLALLCLPQTTSSRDQAQLVLISAELPMFPRIAQTAHITGEVKASFVVDASGNVVSVNILSGPKLLGDVTEKNIRTWKFVGPGEASQQPWEDHSTFAYKLVADQDDTLAVRMRSYRQIEIDAPVHMIY